MRPAFENKIFFSNPVVQFSEHRADILRAVQDVCDNGPHILGPVVEAFEVEFAAWNQARYAVGVGSGTDALVLAMKTLGIGPGDEVITVSHTALATVAAVVLVGATPVLVDVDPDSCVMDPQGLAAAVTGRTKAIIPVHLYGFACPMDEIMQFARAHSLLVIEDCAQAHGALYRGKKVGTIGDVGCFSFYPTKNLGAIGDGGAIITDDANIAEGVKQRRQYGWNDARIANVTGALSRLDSMQAAILSIKLKSLDDDNAYRRDIARVYDRTIDWGRLSRPNALPDVEQVYHLYVVKSERRDDLRTALAKDNVDLGIHYAVPAHKNPGYAERVVLPRSGLPVTEKLSQTVLSLPIYPGLPLDWAKKIGELMNDAS